MENTSTLAKLKSSFAGAYLYALAILAFWLMYFAFWRLVFICYQLAGTAEISVAPFLGAFINGLRLDFSQASYAATLGFALQAIWWGSAAARKHILNSAQLLLIFIFTALNVSNLELYRHWGFHVDSSVLVYFASPAEMLASSPLFSLALLFVFWAAASIGASLLMSRKVARLSPCYKIKWYMPVLLLLSAGLMFIPIRGGLGLVALNSGSAYFSTNAFANHSAVNPVWNFQYSLIKYSELGADFAVTDSQQAWEQFRGMRGALANGGQESVLAISRPNITIIVLESFTGKLVGSIGGENGVSPRLDALASEGILFSKMYSAADRSDKGLVAILSGVPALPKISMNKYPAKTQHFSGLAKSLKKAGYSNKFYHGGNIEFANLKSYLVNSGFNEFVTISDFPREHRNAKWGIHDHIVFDRLYADISDGQSGKKFRTLFTLSSHEPFDVPMENVFYGGHADELRNAIYYTDKSLGDFFDKARKLPCWDSTLYILISDHGTRTPGPCALEAPERHHIPMLWLGGAIKDKGTEIKAICAQFDLPSTLLGQLNLPASDFIFGRDILSSSYKPFAFYSFNNGYGIFSGQYSQLRNSTSGKLIENNFPIQDSLIGLSVQQLAWEYFMGK
jgi:phosphoglycerol transferase MdoB-like AlkP superfamily enzyme